MMRGKPRAPLTSTGADTSCVSLPVRASPGLGVHRGVRLGWVSSVPPARGTECTRCKASPENRRFSINARAFGEREGCIGEKPGQCVRACLWKVLPASVVVLSCQLVVDCLCPAMVITADDALLCQAVTPYSHRIIIRQTPGRGRAREGGRVRSNKGQREDLAGCLRGV